MKISQNNRAKKEEKNKKKLLKPKKQDVLIVAQEIKFARSLSSNEKKIRDRALKTLKKWLLNCFQKGYEFKEEDFLRIWKGLFYAVWMSDKPLVQEELCENIAGLLDVFPPEHFEDALLMVKVGLRAIATEWYGIDQHRIDKCLMYVQNNKAADNDWFRLESDKTGTRWFGKCWYVHNLLKYEFDLEFDIPVTYPTTAPELALPGLDGKTAKMYRGGKICLTDHFKPLWARNVPKFGIAHAMALGLGPWLAVEIPDLIEKGAITYQEKTEDSKK